MTRIKSSQPKRSGILIILSALALVYVLSFFISFAIGDKLSGAIDFTRIQMLITMFTSILLEAFPFLLLGVIVSSLIQVFVSEEFITRIIPRNGVLGVILGTVMGFFFPVCDCSVIPVARRLINKGVPVYIAVTFMLTAPLINPVVILATNYAFGSLVPGMVYYRTLLGIAAAIVIAFLVSKLSGAGLVLKKDHGQSRDIHHDACGCGHCHHHENGNARNAVAEVISHTEREFFDIGKYLIFGAFIASLSQVYLPRDLLLSAGQNQALSIGVMMLFAYVISLCSTSDSFIAKTFVSQFSSGSILAFLILGPMLDIKNTVILFGSFRRKFVIRLIIISFVVVFTGVYLAEKFIGIY